MARTPEIDPSGSYRLAEAARLTGVTWHAIWEAIRDGRLPATGGRGQRRVAGSDLIAWSAHRQTTSTAYADRVAQEGEIDPDVDYTVAGAARAKHVAYGTVRRAIKHGRLPAYETAEGWRVRGVDLLPWEPSHRQTAPAGWLTVREVAARRGVVPGTVHIAIKRGHLPARTVGGRLEIAESDLLKWWPATRKEYAPRSSAERRLVELLPELPTEAIEAALAVAERYLTKE
jgi:excisionase family DNA binding protein